VIFEKGRSAAPSFFMAKQRGYILILVALSILPILGLVGLVTDVGLLRLAESRLQTAVNAAALSGSSAYANSSASPEADFATAFDATLAVNFPAGSFIARTPAIRQANTDFTTDGSVTRIEVSAVAGVELILISLFQPAEEGEGRRIRADAVVEIDPSSPVVARLIHR